MKAFADDDLAHLRAAFSEDEPGCPPGGCPSEQELWASAAGELDPPADETIILHLAQCGDCSMIWRLAREMLRPDRSSSSSVIPPADRRRSQIWRKILLPAVAATVLIGVGLSAAWLQKRGASSPPVFRQQQNFDAILRAPETDRLPRAACRLEWSAGPDGARYDFIATDERLEILSSVKGLERPVFTLPEETIPASTREVFWRVTAHLPDGRILSSETFTTRIADSAPATE